MASRKEQKEQARAATPGAGAPGRCQGAATTPLHDSRWRPRRRGGRDRGRDRGFERRRQQLRRPAEGARRDQDLRAGQPAASRIPQQGTTLGNPKAPVTITVLRRPRSVRSAATSRSMTSRSSSRNQVRTGKAKVVYKSFCTATGCAAEPADVQHAAGSGLRRRQAEHVLALRRALLPPAGQGGHGLRRHRATSTASPRQIPKLNLTTWKTDQGDPALLSQVQADEQSATAQGLSGTPTLIMTGKKGSEIVEGTGGALPNYSNLAAAVQAVQ